MNDLGLGDEENGSDAEYMSGLQDCYDLINNASTVKSYTLEDLEKAKNNGYKWGRIDGQATVRPQGEWIIDDKPWGGSQGWRCSLCNSKYDIHKLYTLMPYNFCPNCGAKMEAVQNEID